MKIVPRKYCNFTEKICNSNKWGVGLSAEGLEQVHWGGWKKQTDTLISIATSPFNPNVNSIQSGLSLCTQVRHHQSPINITLKFDIIQKMIGNINTGSNEKEVAI